MRAQSSRHLHGHPPSRRASQLPANHHGIHLLRSTTVIRSLVESADINPGDLVLDLGAGPGTLTGPLADTGARILAIERDPGFVRRLHRRFGDRDNVRIVEADLRTAPLPSSPFQVVASIPYSLSTTLVRRLLRPARTPLRSAHLVVEWGFAKRISRPYARDLETAWWGARFELHLVRRIRAAAFRPAPAVDSAHLAIRNRPGMREHPTLQALYALLAGGYRAPGQPARTLLTEFVPKRRAHRICAILGLAPGHPAGEITVAQWAELAALVSATAGVRSWPALPRDLVPRHNPDSTRRRK
ncbi:ribosomal RNA small subunit methyltransferase A [Actinopolymorpha alba]|uniref:ribosomal RNA small subunit methyltransferase A n=1 Tax=Actinopolymorpha alba TaxID=533267 RepID=UPI00037A0F5A|nr:rRNA adenine N(6)-methyltransferase family protein [Actinopolymorpha alba]